MALVLTVQSADGATEVASATADARFPASVGDVVTLTVTATAGEDLTGVSVTRQENQTPLADPLTASADGASHTGQLTIAAETFGTYVAATAADRSDAVELTEAPITTPAQPGANQNPEPDTDKPAELEVGELDRPFAYITFFAFVVPVSVAIGWLVWSIVSRVAFPDPGVTSADVGAVIDGTFLERAATMLLLTGAGLGGIVLIAGVWLAALETRGRLRKAAKPGDTTRGIDTSVVDKIPAVLKAASTLRGTMATIIAGAALVAVAMWGISTLAQKAPAEPAPTPSPTAVPTDTPTPDDTPAPTDTAAPTETPAP